jgi:hypothetical protein
MLVLRYFAYVGAALAVLLYGWASYLPPVATPKVPAPVTMTVIFRPPPAPPVVETEQHASVGTLVPSVENDKTDKAAAAAPKAETSRAATHAKPRKRKTQVVHQRVTAQRSFAYVPPRPYFYGWR